MPSFLSVLQSAVARPLRLAACAGLYALLFAAPASAVPVFSVSYGSSSAGTVDVFVNAKQVTDLYAYQFTLTFNSSVIAARNVAEGSFLASAGTSLFDGGMIDNSAGSVSYVLGTLLGPIGGANGSGVLAIISFDVLRPAIVAIGLTDAVALDASLADIPLTTQDAVVNVPEPDSRMLLGMGLIALAALRYRSRRHRLHHAMAT